MIEGNLTIQGNLELSCNLINDVSGITFCDGTYIGQGNSFDISTSEVLKVNSDALVVDTNKNIGIGTVDPSDILHIVRNQAGSTRINLENTDANGLTTLRFTSDQGAAAAIYENASNDFTIRNATPNGALRLQTTNGNNDTKNAVYIDGSHNIGIDTTSPSCSLDISRTDAIQLPSGTTQQQPINSSPGMIRYNSELDYIEFFSSTVNDWISISTNRIIASGGTIIKPVIDNDNNAYRIHAFTNTGVSTFVVSNTGGNSSIDLLVVAGGGGGGGNRGGGGGAGELYFVENKNITVGNYTIQVGEGGNRGDGNQDGFNGENSSFDDLTVVGGGGGGSFGNPGKNGGSGGGGGSNGTFAGGSSTATIGIGNKGGDGNTNYSNVGSAGGGGGATTEGIQPLGSPPKLTISPNGGFGIDLSNIFTADFGVDGRFAGGGGGGTEGNEDAVDSTTGNPKATASINGRIQGFDGGGNSGLIEYNATIAIDDYNIEDGTNATLNTGGGGGGGGYDSRTKGGAGGSGIVIIRYRI